MSKNLQNCKCQLHPDEKYSVTTFGASGDLSRKKIYPILWILYRDGLLPSNTRFYGFARSKLTINDVRARAKPYTKLNSDVDKQHESFWALNEYLTGYYDNESDFEELNKRLAEFESGKVANRIFYLAVPPCVYKVITTNLKKVCTSKTGFTRIVMEKPFGKDLKSFEELSNHITSLFTEQQIYRVDHYLGKEMLQNITTFRFANRAFSPAWNRQHIAAVRIDFKEDFGAQGRGGYFDEYGMIRDVMQNHLLQVLTLIAMEKPKSCMPNDITEAKVNLLKAIKAIDPEDTIIGQYFGNPGKPGQEGYLEDPTVTNKNSLTPTYALAVLKINNDRWKDVPFILNCGKGLDECKVEARIQFLNSSESEIYEGEATRNELVIRIQPVNGIYLKMNVKSPGMISNIEESDLDWTYSIRYPSIRLPDAYERLILDIFSGSQVNFVKHDELLEAWRIFTPWLDHIENDKVKPIPYIFGSRTLAEADEILKKNNFICTDSYHKSTHDASSSNDWKI